MASYNRIILMGNLTRDPQLSYTANNLAVAEFGLAVNHKRKGPDGQLKDEPMFIDCKVFDKKAETFTQYMAKGRPVLIEGRLELRQWQTPEGQKRSKHSVIVDNFQFVGAADRSEGGPAAPSGPRPAQHTAPSQADAVPNYDAPEPAGPEDDIPF